MDISISAETLFHLFSFPITNSLLVTWIVMIAIIGIAFLFTRRLQTVPGRLQSGVELVYEGLLSLFDSVTGDSQTTRRIFPLVGTVFLLVLFVNWSGLIPGAGTIGLVQTEEGVQHIIPFLRAASADLNFTLALSLVSVIMVQVWGIGALGFKKYTGKFISFKSPVAFFVGLLEIVSEISKVISFSFRLFGNIFAGEVLLTVILSLTYYLVPVPFFGLELFVGFIQALVFSLLTAVFVTLAQQEAH